jgi:hypothetical protein
MREYREKEKKVDENGNAFNEDEINKMVKRVQRGLDPMPIEEIEKGKNVHELLPGPHVETMIQSVSYARTEMLRSNALGNGIDKCFDNNPGMAKGASLGSANLVEKVELFESGYISRIR